MPKTPKPAYTVEYHGSIWLLRPNTVKARKYLQSVTDGTWFGNALAVEPRYMDNLCAGLMDDGWTVAL